MTCYSQQRHRENKGLVGASLADQLSLVRLSCRPCQYQSASQPVSQELIRVFPCPNTGGCACDVTSDVIWTRNYLGWLKLLFSIFIVENCEDGEELLSCQVFCLLYQIGVELPVAGSLGIVHEVVAG